MAESMLLPGAEVDALTLELSKEVLTVLAPDELPFFADVVQDFHDGRQAGPDSRSRDEPLGFGIELSLLAPYVVAVMPSVVSFLADILAASAKQEAATALGLMIRRLFKRPSAASEATVRLTAEQGRQVRGITYKRAMAVGLDKERAGLLADAVVGSLSMSGSDDH